MPEEKKEEIVENQESGGRIKKFLGLSKILGALLNYAIMAVVSAGTAYFISYIFQKKNYSDDVLYNYEMNANDTFERRPVGTDWTLDEMLVNTADDIDSAIIKAVFVISYLDKDPKVLEQLSLRKTEIFSTVRNIVGSKKVLEVNSTEKQKLLAKEIKIAIQRIIGMPGIIDVYIKDFVVH